MDPTALERLQKLQMADLGTARREFITTTDDKKRQAHLRLEQIEARRASNIPGTAAQRDAEQHKEKLAAWSDLYKSVADTEGLEHLDDMMHGQSHRAHLTAMLHQGEGQDYSLKETKGSKKHHIHPPTSLGRGGGVIGTRGRGSKISSKLDPALDSNSDDSPRGRGRGRRKDSIPRAAAIRARRPIEDFSRKITAPEVFMAAARKTYWSAPDSDQNSSAPSPRAASMATTKQPQHQARSPQPEKATPVSTPANGRAAVVSASISASIFARASPSTPAVTKTPTAPSSISTSRFAETPTPPSRTRTLPPVKPIASNMPKKAAPPSESVASKGQIARESPYSISHDSRITGLRGRPFGMAQVTSDSQRKDARKSIFHEGPTSSSRVNIPTTPGSSFAFPDHGRANKSLIENDSGEDLIDMHAGSPEKEEIEQEPNEVILSPGLADLKGLEFSVDTEKALITMPSVPSEVDTSTQSLEKQPESKEEVQKAQYMSELSKLARDLVEKLSDCQNTLGENVVRALGVSPEMQSMAAALASPLTLPAPNNTPAKPGSERSNSIQSPLTFPAATIAPAKNASEQNNKIQSPLTLPTTTPTPGKATSDQSNPTHTPEFSSSFMRDWLQETPTGPQAPSTIRPSFSGYRSPVHSPSSSDSMVHPTPIEAQPPMTPLKSDRSDCMIGFETLRVSDPSEAEKPQVLQENKPGPAPKAIDTISERIWSKANPESEATNTREQEKKNNPLDKSIHAVPWTLYHEFGKAKVIGVRPPPSMTGNMSKRVVSEVQSKPAIAMSMRSLSQSNPNIPQRPTQKLSGVRTIGPPPPMLRSTISSDKHPKEVSRAPLPSSQQSTARAVPKAENQPNVSVLGPAPFNPRRQ
ncbi:hypothetical protein NUU61_009831 [Penicillium alfredii]|uniref:Uncharacterized protein n=1 Tax=Penicillium alfredii TaxID=1506179 RepID=A0A9W9EGU1_9EURO|nr:uncharacterized protein NUU61_009831 [Penicillium alfredii]KAJ5081567.1 hypothetical protein NUU61_009831 [Penicillium alfredii]